MIMARIPIRPKRAKGSVRIMSVSTGPFTLAQDPIVQACDRLHTASSPDQHRSFLIKASLGVDRVVSRGAVGARKATVPCGARGPSTCIELTKIVDSWSFDR